MWVGQNIYLSKLGPIEGQAGYMGISSIVIAFGFAVKIQSSLAGQKVPWVIDVSNWSPMCWTNQATISRSWYSMPQLCISFSWIRTTCDPNFPTSSNFQLPRSLCPENHSQFNLGSGFFNTYFPVFVCRIPKTISEILNSIFTRQALFYILSCFRLFKKYFL